MIEPGEFHTQPSRRSTPTVSHVTLSMRKMNQNHSNIAHPTWQLYSLQHVQHATQIIKTFKRTRHTDLYNYQLAT